MTVAMALAERTHHSSRGQTIARAGVWGHELNYTATIRDPSLPLPPPPPTHTHTPKPELFSLYEQEFGGVRPGSVTDNAPQERVERHIVEHRVEACPFVKILDALVPQMAEELPDVLQFFDALMLDLEQVIEVPKFLPEDVPMRITVRDTQVAGSADDRILFFLAADCGAASRHSSSWSWRANRWSSRFSSRTEFNSAAGFSGKHF